MLIRHAREWRDRSIVEADRLDCAIDSERDHRLARVQARASVIGGGVLLIGKACRESSEQPESVGILAAQAHGCCKAVDERVLATIARVLDAVQQLHRWGRVPIWVVGVRL